MLIFKTIRSLHLEIGANSLYKVHYIKFFLNTPSPPHTLQFATMSAEFSLLYKQIHGIVMGSPLGPEIANILVDFMS